MKAKTKATEIRWIFFGIHTVNALEIGRRIQHSRSLNFKNHQKTRDYYVLLVRKTSTLGK